MRMPAKNRVTAIVRSIIGENDRPMPQPDFCKMVGISESHLSKIESARAVPLSPEFAMLIEHHCGVDAGWLLESNPKKKPVTPDGSPFTGAVFEMRRTVLDSAKPIPPGIAGVAVSHMHHVQHARSETVRTGKKFKTPEASRLVETHFRRGAARMQLAAEGIQTFVDGLRQCERLFHFVETASSQPNAKVAIWRMKQLLGKIEAEFGVPSNASVFDMDGDENLAPVVAGVRSFLSDHESRVALRTWFSQRGKGLEKNPSGTSNPKGKNSRKTTKRGGKDNTGRH